VTRARDNASNVAGDISGVTAGTGLTGGGSSGALTISLDTPVSATNGGTAQSTFTTGDILYSSAANTLAKLNIGTTSQVLTVTNGLPTYANGSRATLTTTGDILYASAANTPARLGIGSADQVLTVSGGIPTWATASAGGWTLLTTTTANNTASTYTYSSLGSHKHICIIGIGLESSTASGASIYFTVNGTSSSYTFAAIENENTSITNHSGLAGTEIDTHIVGLGFSGEANTRFGGFKLEFLEYGGSTFKPINYEVYSYGNGLPYYTKGMGSFNSTSAITSIQLKTQVGFKNGTIKVYGVS
jgi:hypothetical protein